MEINKFNRLIESNYDVAFNYKDIGYAISTYDKDGDNIISLADESKWYVEFKRIEDLDSYFLIDKAIKEIIEELSEEEIFY